MSDTPMSRLERIESLFHEARALPAAIERRRWLEAQCPGDPDTPREVLELLESHQAIAQPEPGERPPPPSVPTARFGAYRAVELLGRGGMSAVYLAHRADGRFEQTVALKIMAGHLAGPEFLRRFEVERQLLASLSHNHITRLLDGGVSSAGDPYLITEYVKGQTIDRYCDQQKLDVNARLRLFLQVCEAVDHAHRKLIVHRDLKPGNILVDDSGAAKLLDFGTAQLAAPGAITLTGARMLTPRYASPEQLRGQRLGVPSDIFSLGVILYELATGAWPFGDPDSKLSELSRAVGDAPVRPPTRAVTTQAAGNRSAPLERLRLQLRGDLSAILLKALEDNPERRYRSVSQFAADVSNYLEQRPVLARRQTAWYRLSKFGRRRRVALTAATLSLLFVAASFGFLYQVRLRNQEKKQHVAGLAQIVAQTSAMIGDHIQKSQLELARGEALSLRDSLEQVSRENPDNPEVLMLLASSYLQLGEVAWFRYGPSLMDAGLALDSYRRSRALFEKADRMHVKLAFQSVLSTRVYQSEMLAEDGRGLDAFREAALLLRDDEANVTMPAARTFASVANLASYYDMLSDRLGGSMAWPDELVPAAPRWYQRIAVLQPSRMTDSIALTVYQTALSDRIAADPSGSPESSRATVYLQLGRLQHQAGLHAEGQRSIHEALRLYAAAAGKTYTSAYVLDHVVSTHVRLSKVAEVTGNYPEALREREQALDLLEKQFAQQPQSLYLKERVAASRLSSAKLLAHLGRRAEALRDGKAGLQFVTENAGRERAAALTLDTAAQRLLTLEPAELRDPSTAREYARRAVAQTASQMPSYLVTLAFAELASGHADDARHAAVLALRRYRQVTEILQPLFDRARYPEAARLYDEWQRQLDKLSDLQ